MGKEQNSPSQFNPESGKSPERKEFKGEVICRLFNDGSINALSTGYALLDSSGRVIRPNEKIIEMFGNPETIEKGELILILPEDKVHIQELIEGRRENHVSRLPVPSQGKYFRVKITAPKLDETNRVILAEVDDISAEVEEIEVNQKELDYMKQKEKDVELARRSIAHDIRNSLTIILGNIAVTKRSIESGAHRHIEMLTRAEKRTNEIDNKEDPSISDIREQIKMVKRDIESTSPKQVSRLETAEKRTNKIHEEELPVLRDILEQSEIKPVNMISVLRKIVSGYEKLLTNGNITVLEQFDDNLPIIKTNPFWAETIVNNLFFNAIRHGFEKKPNLPPIDNPTITLQCRVDKNRLVVKIGDNGHGIPPKNKEKIFNRGFTTHAEGSGEGLHIVTNAAGRIGGRVNVESLTQGEIDSGLAEPETRSSYIRAKRGSIFTVSIPLEEEK